MARSSPNFPSSFEKYILEQILFCETVNQCFLNPFRSKFLLWDIENLPWCKTFLNIFDFECLREVLSLLLLLKKPLFVIFHKIWTFLSSGEDLNVLSVVVVNMNQNLVKSPNISKYEINLQWPHTLVLPANPFITYVHR